jgi:hypothetical protein
VETRKPRQYGATPLQLLLRHVTEPLSGRHLMPAADSPNARQRNCIPPFTDSDIETEERLAVEIGVEKLAADSNAQTTEVIPRHVDLHKHVNT